MKINEKILCLPPYISTSWKNVTSILFRNGELIINLNNGEPVHIPNLAPQIVEAVFTAHAQYVESHLEIPPVAGNPLMNPQMVGDSPFKIGFSTTDGLGAALQHNPDQAGAPNLPPEMLEKLGAIAKIVAPEDLDSLPKPEPHCNCVHCQIARSIQRSISGMKEEEIKDDKDEEEEIRDEDLKFQEWDITQTGDQLFTVVNRLDAHEMYRVFLGHPVGCTCGKPGCEHILAVLKS